MTQQGVKGPGNPWLKFYPSDWRADPALRMCSLAARGLWMEMLCVMHENGGYLAINGNQVTLPQLTNLAGGGEVTELLAELEGAGVFSRQDTDGLIFSRRMLRDIEKAGRDKANGKRGGNPQVKAGVNPSVDGEDKAQKPEARSHIPDKTPPSVPLGERGADRFDLLVEAYPPSPHTHRDKAKAWFHKQSGDEQQSIVTAAAVFSAGFWTAQRSKGRSEVDALQYAPGLHTWLIDGGWRAAADAPPSAPAVAMERLDRMRDEDLWLACERIQGRPAPTSDSSWAFKKSVVDQARSEILEGLTT